MIGPARATNGLPPHARFERKLPAARFSLAEVVAIVRRHPALFREVYPARTINNIYLDSANLQDYFQHVEGVANRHKTRIRWYGRLDGRIASPTLERKVKRGFLSGKLSHPLCPLTLDGSLSREALDSVLVHPSIPEGMRMTLRWLQPSLVNRYQRRYWLSACGRFRLTVDWDLEFFAFGDRFSATPLSPRIPGVIVELKYGVEHADDAAMITNAFPFRLARCSKYVLGIERMRGR